MKKRVIFNDLLKYLDHKNALIIIGLRQVGKTTIMKQLYREVENPKLWFDFDNPLHTLYFEGKDYDNIFSILKNEAGNGNERLFIFIDEIQNFPEITRIIKYHIDHYNVKYVVTGSSNYYLKNLFPESLSGRKFLFNLHPLSFNEFLYFKGLIPSIENNVKIFLPDVSFLQYSKFKGAFDEYLQFGGFPEIALTDDYQTKQMVLNNIFTSFFEKDIRIVSDIKDIRELRDLILLLVPRVGNIIDVTKLSSALGISRPKVYNYLELLTGLFFIKLIPKFSKSFDRSVAGGKKVYFSDTGILNVLGKVNEGQLFENAVANQLSMYGSLSYYNVRNTSEIDFILDDELAFEVKIKSSERDLEKLKKLAEKIGIPDHFLISKEFSNTKKTLYPGFI